MLRNSLVKLTLLSIFIGVVGSHKVFAYDWWFEVQLVRFEESSLLGQPSYSAIVKVLNIDYEKQVAIHGSVDGTWDDYQCSFLKMLPGGPSELWQCDIYGIELDQFVIKYSVNSATYWDNNDWNNYIPNDGVVLGSEFNILVHDSYYSPYDPGRPILINIDVRNLSDQKDIRVRWTADNWATYTDSPASYEQSWDNWHERWKATINLESINTHDFEYAVYYTLPSGEQLWDNNFDRNYKDADCIEVAPGMVLPSWCRLQ